MKHGPHAELELRPDQIRKRADPSRLGFTTTEELSPPPGLMGQQRAQEAIDFALEIEDDRYNLYVSGMPGSGRKTSVLKVVNRVAAERPAPGDWCYVYHFDRPNEPLALALPAGSGHTFAHDVDAFVAGCRRDLAHVFGSNSYRTQRASALKDVTAKNQQVLDGLVQQALAHGFLLRPTSMGMSLIPVERVEHRGIIANHTSTRGPHTADLRPLTPEEFSRLSREEQEHLRAENELVQEMIAQAMPQLQALQAEARECLQKLDADTAQHVVDQRAEELLARYGSQSRVETYVRHMQADIIAHARILGAQTTLDAMTVRDGDGHGENAAPELAADGRDGPNSGDAEPPEDGESLDYDLDPTAVDTDAMRERLILSLLLRRYRVNVFVAHSAEEHAPVTQEINPTPWNLLGHTEFGLRDGLPYTDHLMIRPGALHRANGGYLILQVRDLFRHPESWDALKRVLRFRVIDVESGGDLRVTPASASLRPEPIPATMKVILIGDPEVYNALTLLDPEFVELFAVRADFDSDFPRNADTERFYAQFASGSARATNRPPLTADAIAALIEEGSRWAEDQERLTARLRGVQDLVLEACYVAKKAGASRTDQTHVAQAIAARERRLGMVPEKIGDLIQQNIIMIDTAGSVVGQVNGLTVLSVADYAFGAPARITARTSPGGAGIVNLERETMMSGPAHSKGILILNGYLTGRFASDFPLSLSGSICFEQIYGEIEGDSASSAELYALLSSLAGVPVNQSLAVTGSVNQRGEVQAVGGVTAKIEGFFKVCRQRGLTGNQGVLIPRANVRNLMVRDEVVDAVRAGQFHIYAVSTIDEGIEILTGVPAGAADSDGAYPEETINGRVSRRLRAFAEEIRLLAAATTPAIAAQRAMR